MCSHVHFAFAFVKWVNARWRMCTHGGWVVQVGETERSLSLEETKTHTRVLSYRSLVKDQLFSDQFFAVQIFALPRNRLTCDLKCIWCILLF